MAVGFRSSSNTGNDTNVSSLSPAVPSGAVADDVMVVVLTRWSADISPAVTPASGFTHVGSQVIVGDAKIDVYWKRLTGGDAGTYTFSWTGSMWSHAHVFCMTGVISTGDPIGAHFTSWTGLAGSIGSLQLTTSFAPGLVWSNYNDTNGTHTPPTSFTETMDFDCGSGAYYLPGTTGTHTASGGSITSSSNAAAVMVALEPEPPPSLSNATVWMLTT
jgi:hypothetical protein